MSKVRQYPLDIPFKGKLSSAAVNYWDAAIGGDLVDGAGGGTWNGAITLTDLDVRGTSSIDISGTIETSSWLEVGDFLNVGTNLTVVDETFLRVLEVSEGARFFDVVTFDIFADFTLGLNAQTILADRSGPKTIGTQTIDCDTATALTLDFTLHDHFVITLYSGGTPLALARYSTAVVITDTHATPERQVKPGWEIVIEFKADTGQHGGIGLLSSAFPASIIDKDPADFVGPSTGQITGADGANDWIRLRLTNIGSAATPRYTCKVEMGGAT